MHGYAALCGKVSVKTSLDQKGIFCGMAEWNYVKCEIERNKSIPKRYFLNSKNRRNNQTFSYGYFWFAGWSAFQTTFAADVIGGTLPLSRFSTCSIGLQSLHLQAILICWTSWTHCFTTNVKPTRWCGKAFLYIVQSPAYVENQIRYYHKPFPRQTLFKVKVVSDE